MSSGRKRTNRAATGITTRNDSPAIAAAYAAAAEAANPSGFDAFADAVGPLPSNLVSPATDNPPPVPPCVAAEGAAAAAAEQQEPAAAVRRRGKGKG